MRPALISSIAAVSRLAVSRESTASQCLSIAVEVFADAFDLDVRFIHPLTTGDRTFMPASHFFSEQQRAHRPPLDRRMVNRYDTLFHHFLDLPVAKRVSQLRAGEDANHVNWKTHSFEAKHVGSSSVWKTQRT